MPEGLKLEELEEYRQERENALREGRPCRYRNPREVYAEDPNLDSYLVERDSDELESEKEQLDRIKDGAANPSTYLADPGQELEEALALQNTTTSTHQNTQSTPNPENVSTGLSVEETDEDVDIPGQTRDYTDEEKADSALLGPDTDSPNHPTPIGAVTTATSPTETNTSTTSVINEDPNTLVDANPHAEETDEEPPLEDE